MAIKEFPPVDFADDNGLLAIGGDLEVESLLLAYRSGIFPWPIFGVKELTWFSPPERCVLFLDNFIVSRSLRRELANAKYTYSFNEHFEQVITACAEAKNRAAGPETWIRPDMRSAYLDLYRAGYAASSETLLAGELVGGLYGVTIGRMFAGESMFYRSPNASKLALCHLVDRLRECGVEWIDCQQQTALLASFGAELIERSQYMELLAEAIGGEQITFQK